MIKFYGIDEEEKMRVLDKITSKEPITILGGRISALGYFKR